MRGGGGGGGGGGLAPYELYNAKKCVSKWCGYHKIPTPLHSTSGSALAHVQYAVSYLSDYINKEPCMPMTTFMA